jgi:hypothetical protein
MPIQFFLSQNHALVAQYCDLRNRVYRRHYPHLSEDFGREEAMDHHSDIVVGYDGRVVAGGRITIARPERPQLMPMEEAGFRLAEAVPQFRLNRESYAEFSRVAVDPAYAQGRRAGMGLILEMAHATARLGVDLVFSICPEPQVRWNATNSRKAGVCFHVFPEIMIATPFQIHMTLCAYTGLIAAERRAFPLSA